MRFIPFAGRCVPSITRSIGTPFVFNRCFSSSVPSNNNPLSAAFSKVSAPFSPPLFTSATGAVGTADYRLFFHLNSATGPLTSPWHQLPLIHSYFNPSNGSLSSTKSSSSVPLFHYINEIPLFTRPKMEIDTTAPFSPIKQDIKKGKLREFTYGDIPFNYGAISQTWENPLITEKNTKCKGDNDPLDVVELSRTPLPQGAVLPIRVLGAIALIDEGECDWKILAVSPYSELFFSALNFNENQLMSKEKEIIDVIRDWFINYKTTDGKEKNVLAEGGKIFTIEETMKIIEENHHEWKQLVGGKIQHNDKTKKLWVPSAK